MYFFFDWVSAGVFAEPASVLVLVLVCHSIRKGLVAVGFSLFLLKIKKNNQWSKIEIQIVIPMALSLVRPFALFMTYLTVFA